MRRIILNSKHLQKSRLVACKVETQYSTCFNDKVRILLRTEEEKVIDR